MATKLVKQVQTSEILAVKEKDIFFDYKKGRLINILINPIKVLEMRENKLLVPSKLQEYQFICLIHAKKMLQIPIVKGSGTYCGRENGRLRFVVSPTIILKQSDLHNWHTRMGNKEVIICQK